MAGRGRALRNLVEPMDSGDVRSNPASVTREFDSLAGSDTSQVTGGCRTRMTQERAPRSVASSIASPIARRIVCRSARTRRGIGGGPRKVDAPARDVVDPLRGPDRRKHLGATQRLGGPSCRARLQRGSEAGNQGRRVHPRPSDPNVPNLSAVAPLRVRPRRSGHALRVRSKSASRRLDGPAGRYDSRCERYARAGSRTPSRATRFANRRIGTRQRTSERSTLGHQTPYVRPEVLNDGRASESEHLGRPSCRSAKVRAPVAGVFGAGTLPDRKHPDRHLPCWLSSG
jgi:hypothetical protein